MQRCPYLHEMKERLMSTGAAPGILEAPPRAGEDKQRLLEVHADHTPLPSMATIVKVSGDGGVSPASHQLLSLPDLRPPPSLHSPACCVPRYPKNAKTSLFIIMSFIYMKLIVVVCIAYVVSEVVTQGLPLPYYEGFFTYLYGVSILFLLYVFCFLLQESSCCQSKPKPPKPKKEKKEKENKKNQKKEKKEKEQKEKKDKKDKKDGKDSKDDGKGGAPPAPPQPPQAPTQQQGQRNSRSNIFQSAGTLKKGKEGENLDLEAGTTSSHMPRRKTTQNPVHGSFFLRVGAIAFGLGTMIYSGLELGAFFEIPFNSPCYMILRGVNPILQMIFTFMQMYFIFMNSRLNIHRFKVIARFGLMHIVATNICVWIRTLVVESLKEITGYLNAANSTSAPPHLLDVAGPASSGVATVAWFAQTTSSPTGVTTATTTLATTPSTTFSTTSATTTTTAATTSTTTTTEYPYLNMLMPSSRNNFSEVNTGGWGGELLGPLAPQALVQHRALGSDVCNRVNIMGTIVEDSAPYLYPFIIEYSLIGAAVIYIMWSHIGKYPSVSEESIEEAASKEQLTQARWDEGEEVELEQRLEVMLSRRAVAMAHARQGHRMDCVGASKGLFIGLLLLVGSLICLILFFVLVHNPQLRLLAIYLADASHCGIMALSVLAIIIGFIRVQGLKFRGEETSDLNDILLRISAFGLFVYAVLSAIAGSLKMMTSEPDLLVAVTGLLAVVQVVLQLLFIADVSRRRVHLPEHDRSKPGRQIVTFLLIANITMWIIYTFEMHKVTADPVQLEFYGVLAWSMVQRVCLPLCIFHRFHSAVTLAEIWKTSYKPLSFNV